MDPQEQAAPRTAVEAAAQRVEADAAAERGDAQPQGLDPEQSVSTQMMPREEPELVGEIEHPARLLRIAMAVQTLFEEVKTTELDEAARERLTDIHNRTIEDLRQLVSGDLEGELEAFTLERNGGIPSGSELRVMQAQLAGWLQGVFHGIQASVATQQMAAQQQLAQMRQQQGPGMSGQYL